ncbi:MAG: metalloregulator ArsR/SmtB family transcription factor [Planctomycetes bacterium]|nr:metalloregulator ArsR/SmtB family transcription factor [Planctomycetota bacterium]
MKHGQSSADAGMCQVASFDPKAVAQARRVLPPTGDIRQTAERLAVLGNPGRLALLLALDGRELCVCDSAKVLGGSVSGASQHLKELRRLGAITFRTAGKMAYYRIADPRWIDLARSALALAGRPARTKASA